MLVKLALAASLVASAAAHSTFQELWINGVDQGSSCARLPQSNSPVTSVSSAVCRPLLVATRSDTIQDIACNAGARSTTGVCQVLPGDQVTVEMHQQPGDRVCRNEAIGGQHYGPVIVSAVTGRTIARGIS